MPNYRVLCDKILVLRDPKQETMTGGIILTDDLAKPPRSGEVIAVGDLVTRIAAGERVVFSEYAGYFLDVSQGLAESDYIVMRVDEVLAVEVGEKEENVVT